MQARLSYSDKQVRTQTRMDTRSANITHRHTSGKKKMTIMSTANATAKTGVCVWGFFLLAFIFILFL